MKKSIYFLLFIGFVLSACRETKEIQTTNSEDVSTQRDTSSGQKSINMLTDKIEMPIIGIAQNQKGGAVLIKDNQTFWIDKLSSWDDKYLNNPVKVWGEIEYRNDAPVFVDTSETISQGIPVESEAEKERLSTRIWIINAHYELVRP